MAAKKGASAIWSLDNASFTSFTEPGGGAITITSTVFNFQSVSGGTRATRGLLHASTGEIIGAAYAARTKEIQIDVIPSGSSLTLAKQGNIRPAHGTKVIIADSDDAQLNGNWIVEDTDFKRSNTVDAPLMLTLKLFNAGASDISADMSTA